MWWRPSDLAVEMGHQRTHWISAVNFSDRGQEANQLRVAATKAVDPDSTI
jgi:hypothetical protein